MDLVETCHVWWIPSFKGVQRVRLFTSMDLIDTPNGKKILRQYDHTLLAETILYEQFPWLGKIATKHVLPTVGKGTSALGMWLFKHFSDKEVVPKLERPLLTDPENAIPRAIEVVFGSSPSRRYALVHNAFTPDAFYYNTWMTVVGPDQIFGVLNFWAMVNSKIEMKILRVVPCGDKILVDSEQRFSPWWWPSALLSPLGWQHHVIMNTVEHPSGGKLISRVENHIIWLEPFLKYNMGPLSWLYERMRPINGKLFGIAGRTIYHVMEWWNTNEVAERVAQAIPNGISNKLDGLTKHY
ncbi:g9717 [Coccomyxa viridis]|uniref:G9717 protein n=1 Tax=Coccomyxa viridis TaxID=1274662 RepID=A0ABP1G3G1_9CHLO